jgi:hypothetical protein
METIHRNKNLMIISLTRHPKVNWVSYEYPGIFAIDTSKGEFHLGDVNGNVGWNNPEGNLVGETNATTVSFITKDFLKWLDKLDKK